MDNVHHDCLFCSSCPGDRISRSFQCFGLINPAIKVTLVNEGFQVPLEGLASHSVVTLLSVVRAMYPFIFVLSLCSKLMVQLEEECLILNLL